MSGLAAPACAPNVGPFGTRELVRVLHDHWGRSEMLSAETEDSGAVAELVDVLVQGVRHRYRRLRMPGDLDELAASMHQVAIDRETREINRLQQVLDMAGHDGCQVSAL